MSLLLLIAAPNLDFGPGPMTFSEIAAAFTRSGEPTAASMALSDRAAYVCLRDRSPATARGLLEKALGVAFQREGAGWRIVVDSAARERDRLLLIAYKRHAHETARLWAARQERLRNGRSYEALARWASATETAFGKFDPANDRERLEPFLKVARELRPERWAAVLAARDAGQIDESMGTLENAKREYRADWPRTTFGLPVEGIRTSLNFDARSGTLSCHAFGILPDGKDRWLPPYPGITSMPGLLPSENEDRSAEICVEGARLAETYARMGSTAKAYLDSLQPNAPLPEKPIEGKGVPYSLSNVLQTSGVEAILELSPRFERMWSHEAARITPLTLRTALTPVVSTYRNADDERPQWIVDVVTDANRSPEALAERTYPWRTRLQDGVWIVSNPLAFLDRAQWISPVPYLTLERLQSRIPSDAPIGYQGQRLPTWSLAIEMGRALPEDAKLYWDYRGIKVDADLLRSARRIGEIDPATWRAATKDWVVLDRPGGTARLRIDRPEPQFAMRGEVARIIVEWRGDDGLSGSWAGTVDGRSVLP